MEQSTKTRETARTVAPERFTHYSLKESFLQPNTTPLPPERWMAEKFLALWSPANGVGSMGDGAG